jgi:hypothetical protein
MVTLPLGVDSSRKFVTWPSLSCSTIPERHRLPIEFAILDARIARLKIAVSPTGLSTSTRRPRTLASTGSAEAERKNTLVPAAAITCPSECRYAATVDHGWCDHADSTLAARCDTCSFQYLDETARTFKLGNVLLGGEKALRIKLSLMSGCSP